MIWRKLYLNDRDHLWDAFKTLVNYEIRKTRRDERRLAEHRTTKHRIQARSSCIVDARSYRVARRFPASAVAEFDWK